jgi:hypothetical protein
MEKKELREKKNLHEKTIQILDNTGEPKNCPKIVSQLASNPALIPSHRLVLISSSQRGKKEIRPQES